MDENGVGGVIEETKIPGIMVFSLAFLLALTAWFGGRFGFWDFGIHD
jgi:hypothetical protein